MEGAILWGGYHYDTMSITTLRQNAITAESSDELVCWKYVSQGESCHVGVSRVTSCVGTKVSSKEAKPPAQWPL